MLEAEVKEAAAKVAGSTKITFQGHGLNLAPPWLRLTVREANTHPFVDEDAVGGPFAFAHNGNITNAMTVQFLHAAQAELGLRSHLEIAAIHRPAIQAITTAPARQSHVIRG